jgi:DNA-binding PadR family transcriptional regulator
VKPLTPSQLSALTGVAAREHVFSGQRNDPPSNTYAWGVLNALRRRGFVIIEGFDDQRGPLRRIARITSEGRRHLQSLVTPPSTPCSEGVGWADVVQAATALARDLDGTLYQPWREVQRELEEQEYPAEVNPQQLATLIGALIDYGSLTD